MKQAAMKIIAHIRSDFPTKFGIPRQSGLVEDLTAQIVFTPEYRCLRPSVGWRISPTYGSSGSSQRPSGRIGPQRCAHPVWVETPVWVSSPPVPPSVPTPLASARQALSVEPSTPEGPGAYSGRC